MVTITAQRKGLRADWVAKQMFHRAWSLFGAPRILTSDQGPQFASAWFHSLCGCMVILQAFAQAYHSQSNGRAEAAGRELQRKLRYLREVCPELSWVEALQVAVNHIHDTPGECGLSPYEIVTGRQRLIQGIPIPVQRECQDAFEVLENQRKVGQKVANAFNLLHQKIAEKFNANRPQTCAFQVGDCVWFRRPPSHTAD